MAKVTRIDEVEEFYAARLARQVAEEVKLKDFLDQTHAQFYLGTSMRSAIIRTMIAGAVLILFSIYYPSDQNPLWPLLAAVAVVELVRIDCRIDALNRLLRIHAQRQSEDTETKTGEQGVADQPTAAAQLNVSVNVPR